MPRARLQHPGPCAPHSAGHTVPCLLTRDVLPWLGRVHQRLFLGYFVCCLLQPVPLRIWQRAANCRLRLWWEVPVMLPVLGGGPSTLELLLEAPKVVGVAGGPQQCQGWGADGDGELAAFAPSLGCIVCAWQRVSCCADPAITDSVGVRLCLLWLKLCSEGHMGWQSQPGFCAQGWHLESQVSQVRLQTNFPKALSVLRKQ